MAVVSPDAGWSPIGLALQGSTERKKYEEVIRAGLLLNGADVDVWGFPTAKFVRHGDMHYLLQVEEVVVVVSALGKSTESKEVKHSRIPFTLDPVVLALQV